MRPFGGSTSQQLAALQNGAISLGTSTHTTGFVVGCCFAEQQAAGGKLLRPGRANLSIAESLVTPPLLGMPKVLEWQLAIAYFSILKRDSIEGAGPVRIVYRHRQAIDDPNPSKPKVRLSATEVVIQAAAAFKCLYYPFADTLQGPQPVPVIPVAAPQMQRRACRDTALVWSQFPNAAAAASPVVLLDDLLHAVDADAFYVPLRETIGGTVYVNPHPWTNWFTYPAWDIASAVRDQIHLSLDAQQVLRGGSLDQPNPALWQALEAISGWCWTEEQATNVLQVWRPDCTFDFDSALASSGMARE